MSNRQTYRVTVLTSQLHVIDIPARDESDAIARAETLWHAGQTQRFDCVRRKRGGRSRRRYELRRAQSCDRNGSCA